MQLSIDATPRRQREGVRPARPWILLAIVCSGFFVVILDTTVVTIALNRIAGSLHTTITGLEWVIDGYTVILASLLLLGGTLSDRLGARRAFQAGLLLFGLASLGCALAGTVQILVAVRMLQGVGGALLIPSSLALIQAAYVDGSQRAKAIGIWGAVGASAASFGPVIGGLLSQTLGWQAVFAVNVPICLLALALVGSVVPATTGTARRLQPWSQLAVVAAVGGVSSLVIQAGSDRPDARLLWASAAVCVSGLAVVIASQRRSREPLLPRPALARPEFRAGNLIGFLLNFGFYGQLFVISLFLQRQLGYSPLAAGLALLPETAMGILASTLGGRYAGRHGPRPVMIAGLLAGAAGLAGLMVSRAGMPYWQLVVPLVLVGFGTAFCMPAATTATLEAAPAEQVGFAAAAFTMSRQVGGALGVAALGSLVAMTDGSVVAAVAAGSAAFLAATVLSARHFTAPHRPAGVHPST